MLKTHLPNILTYLRHRITNATAEGLNSKIQWIRYTRDGYNSHPRVGQWGGPDPAVEALQRRPCASPSPSNASSAYLRCISVSVR